MSVTAHRSIRLYVLTQEDAYWLGTIATSRRGSWALGMSAGNTNKKQLQVEGWRCAPCVLIETLLRPADVLAAVESEEVRTGE